MQGQILYRSTTYSAAVILLILLYTGYCCMAQEDSTLPERCTKSRPTSSSCNSGERERKWILHKTKGCKKSGFCPQDVAIYDSRNDLNYFTSEQACVEACMTYVKCPTLAPISNGSISNGGAGHWGSTVTYTCDKGFSLVGTSVRTCEYNASWTSQAPMCQAKCPAPAMSQDGLFTYAPVRDFYNRGDTIIYSCKEGYINRASSNRRTCLEDGTWSGDEAVCELGMMCPEPELIEHGTPYAPNLIVGSLLTYQCDNGFILHGNATRRCNQEGSWTGEKPVCFKFMVEKCLVGSDTTTDHSECSDVTDKIVRLNEGDSNLWFVPRLTKPAPFDISNAKWNIESEDIAGVDVIGYRLKFSAVRNTQVQERTYTVSIGHYQAQFTVNIDPRKVALMIKSNPTNQESVSGNELTMYCTFEGEPSPDVTWYHNGTRVTQDGRVTIDTREHYPFVVSMLTISIVTPEDSGSYQCLANNSHDTKYSDVGVVSIKATQSTVKRSAEEENPMCLSKTSSNTVTIVGRVKRESLKFRAPGSTTYRVEIARTLSSGSRSPTRRNLRTVVLHKSTEAPHKLDRNALYIMQGRLHDNTLFVYRDNSVLSHSTELEQSLQSC